MKRAVRYFSCIMLLGVMFSACYYASYKNAIKKLKEMETKQDINSLLDDKQKQAETMFSDLLVGVIDGSETNKESEKNDPPDQAFVSGIPDSGELEALGEVPDETLDDSQEAATVKEAVIAPETKIVIESLEISTGDFVTKEMVPDAVLVGMTRQDLVDYLAKELEDMTISEYEKGLYANELITFSENKVVIRKSYDSSKDDYMYYLAIKNGEIVVYFNDRRTVYEYTGIKALSLQEDVRLSLLEGICVHDSEELFSLLESYSS